MEYELTKEKAIEAIAGVWSFEDVEDHKDKKGWLHYDSKEKIVGAILSLVEIKSDDQSLPSNPYSPPLDKTQEIWSDIVVASQRDMLKPDSEGKHWAKVEPKRK